MSEIRITQSSNLAVGVQEMLATLTMAGVNAELWPLVRMTCPAEWTNCPLLDWPEGQHLFDSWILLLCVLPIDRHRFYLRSVSPGRGFVEDSSSLINAMWHHERNILPIGTGCRVIDTVAYQCRFSLLGYILKPVYRLVFWWRHRNLRSNY
jgi:hypothetical protein